jgi:uncharacterized protein DUF6788
VGYKTTTLSNLSVRQLRARRTRLAKRLPDVERTLRGSLQTQSRRCGKEGCRCATGELHGPYVYLSMRSGGGTRLLYIAADLAEEVKQRVEMTSRLERALAEISAINLELLARGELS